MLNSNLKVNNILETQITMTEIREEHTAPQDIEHKLISKTRRLLRFFNVDASKWDQFRLKKWILMKIFLFIIALALGIYTMKTSLPIILDYARNPTSCTSRAVINESITLPPSKVCLPLSPFELDRYWKGSKNISSSKQTAHYQSLISVLSGDITYTKEYLLGRNNKWPEYLLFIAHHYLNLIMQFDALYGQQQIMQDHYLSFIADYETLYGSLTIDQSATLNNSYNDLMKSITSLDGWMTASDISAYELKVKYGSEIERLFIFQNNRWNSLHELIPLETSFSSFQQGYNCFLVYTDQYPLYKEHIIVLHARRSYLPNPHHNPNLHMKIGIGGRLSDDLFNLCQETSFNGWMKVIPLQVTANFTAMPYIGGERRCNEHKSLDMCEAECRQYYLQEICSCFSAFGHVVSLQTYLRR